MKTTIRNSAFLAIALFASLTMSTVTKANDEKKDKSVTAVEFKYIGKIQNQPLFQLKVNGSEKDEFTISFRDNFGTVLYSTVVSNNFSQKYALNPEEVGDETITVEVRSKKTKKTETFSIKRNQTLVDETVVAKIN